MIKNSFQELERALIKWIYLVREKKIALNGPMVEGSHQFATSLFEPYALNYRFISFSCTLPGVIHVALCISDYTGYSFMNHS